LGDWTGAGSQYHGYLGDDAGVETVVSQEAAQSIESDVSILEAYSGAGGVEDADDGDALLPGHLDQFGNFPDSLISN